ncbi:MAG: hypothetical protein ACE5PV_07265 [Candidatus Poribacteria bacterium]
MKKLTEEEKQKLRETMKRVSVDGMAKASKGVRKITDTRMGILWGGACAILCFPSGIILGIYWLAKGNKRLGAYTLATAIGITLLLPAIISLLRIIWRSVLTIFGYY